MCILAEIDASLSGTRTCAHESRRLTSPNVGTDVHERLEGLVGGGEGLGGMNE